MKILTSNDLKNWSTTRECQGYLPLLIRKLIYSGVKIEHIKEIDFPFAEDVQVGGYDGQLKVDLGNRYIPDGESVWEFGVVENGKKKKADEDYEKRKLNPLGKTPSQTTYLNITLKTYTKKKKWVEDKKAENFWADVRFYDATDIEHWLDLAPVVEIWLARLMGKSVVGLQCGDDYWTQWSTKENINLPYSLLTESRIEQKEKLLELLLESQNDTLYIKSNTSEESLGFALAVIESLETDIKKSLFSQTLVVENKDSFRQLIENISPLILISKFQLDDIDINRAITNGHKVIVPVSNSFSVNNNKTIILPIVSSDVFRESLLKMGIDQEKAQLLSMNTGKDISVLRRNLEFSSKKPAWLRNINPLKFIPFLLISRYDSAVEGDRQIIDRISDSKYDDYEKELRLILDCEDTPIYNIGSKWRLVSHSDSWLYLAKYVTDDDLKKFYDIAVEVISEVNPKYDLDSEKRLMASFYNATPKYSNYLKKGICETLIVLSVLAKKYGLNTTINPEHYVDKIITHVLSLADGKLLRSFGNNLALLAEASPKVFINQINNSINNNKVEAFFEEEKDFILSSRNDLPYLLWALERVAWMPEYLTNVSRILCKLIEISPKKLPTSNTPYNTLVGIFRIWFPQTNANMDERKQVLEILKKEFPDIAFKIFSSLIYSQEVATVGTKMRWRLFSETRQVSVTHQELNYMHSYVVDSLIELAKQGDYSRAIVLINKLDDVNWDKIDNLLLSIEKFANESEENKSTIYHKFRDLIGRHRTYSSAKWAKPEEILKKMEVTATKFKPNDVVLLKSYLFEDYHPILMNGKSEDTLDDFEKRREEFEILRKNAVKEFIEEYNIDKVVELVKVSKNVHLYAKALIQVGLNKEQEHLVFDLVNSTNEKEKWFFQSYISEKENSLGRKSILNLIENMYKEEMYSSDEIAEFLIPLNANEDLFKYIDSLDDEIIEKRYWNNIRTPYAVNSDTVIYAVKKLSKFNRPVSVLNMLSRQTSERVNLPVDFIVSTLYELNLSIYNEPKNTRLDSHFVQKMFEELQEKDELDEEKMAEIEFKFLFVFDKYGKTVFPKYLYKSIAKTPSLYIDLIKTCFVPRDEKFVEKENKEITEEQKKIIFENAYGIISDFNIIPGMQSDGKINKEELFSWIEDVRKLAKEFSRLEVTDSKIGELLTKCPKEKSMQFPVVIYDALEKINTTDIYSGFYSGIYNNMGVTVRSPYSGGEIERNRATQFEEVLKTVKITHPNVAQVYRDLISSYQSSASRQDEEALRNIIEN